MYIETVKYIPSALIGQLSRSQGSTTASHNRYGSYLRNRVTPVNPRSPGQTANRALIATFSQLWRTITASQRVGWTNLGTQMIRTDSLGSTYTLTGLQAFTSVNRNLQLIGLSALLTAPALTNPTNVTSITITATSV